MRIATVVLTAPRPKPTLARTLRSLEAAGRSRGDGPTGGRCVRVYRDRESSGHFRAYMAALHHAVQRDAAADAYFLVEDDVVVCRGLYAYLQRTLWPGPDEKLALCSPYCPQAYRQKTRGWSDAQSGRGLSLAGSQAWVFSAWSARAVLAEVAPLCTVHNADREIGAWAKATGRQVWYHTPSLGQHVGIRNSSLGDDTLNSLRIAGDFPGEEACP
ncbi:MAG: hypothetical protein JXB62_19975 [Pirellulales bacterium]|nr:hypothetical protein [Pirellulales bacterium]